MRISGIIPLRNAVTLGYPFEIAIFSMRGLCDEIVVLVDPTSTDDTLRRVEQIRSVPWCTGNPATHEMGSFVIVESRWDMNNHRGHGSSEIAKQTGIAYERATGDWIMSLQADEVLHEDEAVKTRRALSFCDQDGITALEMTRWYFFGSLTQYRDNWTVPLNRLVKRGCWRPDPNSGAMYFVPVGEQRKAKIDAGIFHYSRVGDPEVIARRVRNLDTFYHEPDKVKAEQDLRPYTFEARKLDTYVIGHEPEKDDGAQLIDFPLSGHPRMVLEYFGAKQ